jgi:hypothetical protein
MLSRTEKGYTQQQTELNKGYTAAEMLHRTKIGLHTVKEILLRAK